MNALPAQFPQFQDLPTEIRLMIWTSLPIHPKIFVVDKPVPFEEDPNFRVSVQLGAIAHVCREARDAILQGGQYPLTDRPRYKDERPYPEGKRSTEADSFATTRRSGWASPQWTCFNPVKDAVFLTSSALRHIGPQSTYTLDRLVGPISNVIVPHHEMDGNGGLFDPLLTQMQLDCVHLLKTIIHPGRAVCSLLKEKLGVSLPLIVSIEDLHTVSIVDSIMRQEPGILEEWNNACAYNSTDTFWKYPYSWMEFRQIIHSDWLRCIAEQHPFGNEAAPPIDEDGLILDYSHPWVKKWNCAIPRFKAVVMFVD